MSDFLGPPALPTLPRTPTIVWMGDSITNNGGGGTAGTGGAVASTSYTSNGFWCWAQFFLGHRFRTLNNSGVAGQTSAQMLARIDTDVIAYRPGWCHILAGTNDVGQAVPVATAQANITAMLDRLASAGIRAIVGTIPPRNTYTGSMLADLHALNQWIRALARRRPNVVVVDYYAAVAAPSDSRFATTGEAGQATSPDGVHPGNGGAPRMGKFLADALSSIIPPAPFPATAENDPTNVLPYNRHTAGTVASGTPPTGWNQSGLVGGPIDYSRVARTDGLMGTRLRMVLPTGCRVNLQDPNALLSAGRFAIGDTVVGVAEVSRSAIDQAAANQTSGASLAVAAVGAGSSSPADLYWVPAVHDNQALWDHSGLMRTPPWVVPANTTALNLVLTLGGGQTVDLGRTAILNLTRYPET